MRIRIFLHLISCCVVLFTRVHCISLRNRRSKTRLNADFSNNSYKHGPTNSAEHKLSKTQQKNIGAYSNAKTRQEILHNLDEIAQNQNADSYSEDNGAINGGFTKWTAWTACSNDCKKRSLRSRERYCTDPPPSNGGANCVGERFQLELCKRAPCHRPSSREHGSHRSLESFLESGNDRSGAKWRFGEWSGWSKCNCKTRHQKRYRECYSHDDVMCPGETVETKPCEPTACGGKSSVVNVNPVDFCGFDPCDISKCLVAPLGSCVSDYKCRPVFFDEKNKQVDECAGKRIYIKPSKVSQACKINPCEYTRCLLDFSQERCVVGTKCQAVYYNNQGEPQKCTAILKVPAHDVCGYDPCAGGETCQDNPTARCLVTSKCRPIYVNAFNERIKKCEKTGLHRSSVHSGEGDEYEAEPDQNDDNDDDIDSNNNDDNDDDNHNEDDDDDDDSSDKDNIAYNDEDEPRTRFGSFNDNEQNMHGKSELEDNEEGDDDDDDSTDDKEDDVRYHGNENGNFNDDLALHHDVSKPEQHQIASRRQNSKPSQTNVTQNSSIPSLFHLLNTETGQRKSGNLKAEGLSRNIDTTSLSLSDILKGKLNSSHGVVTGTVRSSMKIISNKKPAKYYYFETKEGASNKTRQFMVITASKTKKSSVLINKSNNEKKK